MIVEVVGAVIRDADGRLLTVRKRGTSRFMLPGGKREPGEDDLTALAREVCEELGVEVTAASLLGDFEAAAANEPGAIVRSRAFVVEIAGRIAIQAEIEELLWIDPAASPAAPIAPLLVSQILPTLSAEPRAMTARSRSPRSELPAAPSGRRPGGG
jgi:8-oxo-dGTP diphosphatase